MESAEVGGVIAVFLAIAVIVMSSRYRTRRKGRKTDEDA